MLQLGEVTRTDNAIKQRALQSDVMIKSDNALKQPRWADTDIKQNKGALGGYGVVERERERKGEGGLVQPAAKRLGQREERCFQ